jgi:hypothetical protein
VHGCGSVLLLTLSLLQTVQLVQLRMKSMPFSGHPMLALFNTVSVECGLF